MKINVNVPLVLENIVIKQVMETKFLVILIDHHLSRKSHNLALFQRRLSIGILYYFPKLASISLLKRCCPCIILSYILV